MTTQIETLKKMQAIEMEAGFPNGELYNELEDRITSIEMDTERKRRGSIEMYGLHSCDKSNPIHY